MTSLKFFDHSSIPTRPAVEWGTGELQNEKFDPTVIKAPTFILKNQPITQYYRESNIELSNVRTNDQLMPAPLKEDLLRKQIQKKFPMNHPFTSQISYNALFPNYTAPEDFKKGEGALTASPYIFSEQTPAQVDDTVVVAKNSGKAWRHEIRYPTLPTQRHGVWYNDQEYVHLPKPHSQQYYPAPPTLLVPNPRLRSQAHSIDDVTANTLKNKERELMQSSNRIEYYVDGLGTRAPVNTNDLIEKKVRFDMTGQVNNNMKPYFRKGAGLTQSTMSFSDLPVEEIPNETIQRIVNNLNSSLNIDNNQRDVLTNVEKDERLMETGKDYVNLPESNYQNNPKVSTFPNLNRANTMPNLHDPKANEVKLLRSNSKSGVKPPANKLDAENRKIIIENNERIQRIQMENRRKELELIKPHNDIRLLRYKNKELENSRGAQPNLKQNYAQHVNTLYQHEGKYLGERAELYKQAHIYNPHLLKQYVDSVKDDSKISATLSNGSAYASQKDVYINPEDEKHRPKLFADKTFHDYNNIKRAPLENTLKNPNASADPVTQENGFILQQSTYGDSYNTKKYLQENEIVAMKRTSEPFYSKLDKAELDYQNITLKSKADDLALSDYKNGLTNKPNDLNRASALVDVMEQQAKEIEKSQYPRLAGPVPPEPYEAIYCNKEISEMSDGYIKRSYSRVYDSPNVKPGARYEPLRTDLEAMHKYEQKAIAEAGNHEKYLQKLRDQINQKSETSAISHKIVNDEAARRSLDKVSLQRQDEYPQSTYSVSYTPYYNDKIQTDPPNEYYKNLEYTQKPLNEYKSTDDISSLPKNLISLQDGWNKTLAHKQYHAAHSTPSADLRENITAGKKLCIQLRRTPIDLRDFVFHI